MVQVGKLPGPDVINTYIMRLREQGWNVENIVKKATKCGLHLIREALCCREGSWDSEFGALGV